MDDEKIDYSLPENMPYGYWVKKDGTEVLFNRRYVPILERPGPSGEIEFRLLEDQQIEKQQQHFFRSDGSKNPRASDEYKIRCMNIMIEFMLGNDVSDFVHVQHKDMSISPSKR